MAEIHQFTPVLSYGDAISDYMLELQRFLREEGHKSEIYVERCHPKVAHLCHHYSQYLAHADEDDTLLLHFSIGCRINAVVYQAPGKVVLIYHNITPHHYFIQLNPVLAAQCYLGRYQLGWFRNRVALALADSDYNRQELNDFGIMPNMEYPIYVSFQKFQVPLRRDLVDLYRDDAVNWLFVGRLIPNKRIDALIRAFALYRRHYRAHARLIVVGPQRGFERYVMQLRRLAQGLGVCDAMVFTDHVSLEELATFYRIADVYVTLSEHEGFCVPLLEAMHFQLPVVAYAAGAVPGTLKGAGVLVHQLEPEVVAEAVHRVTSSEALRDKVLSNQARILKYYKEFPYKQMFLSFLGTVIE